MASRRRVANRGGLTMRDQSPSWRRTMILQEKIGLHLWKEKHPDLLIVYFEGTDSTKTKLEWLESPLEVPRVPRRPLHEETLAR